MDRFKIFLEIFINETKNFKQKKKLFGKNMLIRQIDKQ